MDPLVIEDGCSIVFYSIGHSGYGGSLTNCVGCVSMNVSLCVSAGVLVVLSTSSMMGIAALD